MAAIIFDFDGTIADSFDVIVDIFEHITKRPEKLTEEQMLELRGYPLEIVAERLHIRWWRIPFLLARGRRMMARRMHEIPVFEGMGKVIEELHAEGHELFVVSSNSKRNVRKFLKAHHMYNHFVDIRGNAGLLGKSRILRRLAHSNSLKIKDCIYIGDETRDVVSAKAIGMPVVAVSWGFASTDFLKSLHPTALAYEPQEIVRILGEI
jgi:phosphoglycolate phosphatase-like HAD superfamily hydrolase